MGTSGTWRIHYAWVIVAIASVMGMVSSPVRFATSIMVPYLRDPGGGFGWSYGAIAFAFTLQWLTLALVAPVIGWLGDRYGVRRAMLLGAFLFIAGMLLTGTMTHLWEFYLFFGVMLGVATTVFTIVLVSGITPWFRTHLGVAIGTLWFFQGIGAILLVLLITLVLDRFGLKWTFWLPGLVGGAILLLLIRPFYNEPAEIGLRPLGAPGDEPIRRLQGDTAKIRARVFLQQARRTGAFWNLIGIHFWGCVGHSSIMVLLVAMAVDRGLSMEKAAGVYITFTIGSLISRLLIPVMVDRMGGKGIWAVCLALQAFPVFILLVARDAWAFHLFAVLFGIGLGGEMTTFPVINRKYYGNAPQGSIYGWQNIGNGLGMALGPMVGGFLWDITGDYVATVATSSVFSLVGVVSILLLPSTSRCLIPNWEESLPPDARSLA